MNEKAPTPQIHEQDLEFAAQLAAHGRLLGQMYAMAFEGRATEFQSFMHALIDNTSRLPVEGSDSPEDILELNARINAHLERFARLTVAKIQNGRV
ncbi:MAG: hypothetical protein LBJ15_19770 [Comamonas sp.]|jgi:hypothetical protein|uniref:hypothetical protein n=1 Tax=Comamonas sp. TaxID=34028 RepID=UPI00282067BC|nr:hypothetical protein [Comamonas sp.]MDR0216215.1 hypothetical protein [Comamonas sp.]